MSRYMEMVFIDSDGNARQTGVGAEFESDEATTAAFESVRQDTADIKTAPFLLDLHDGDGDIIDTIPISAETYAAVTGEPVLSEAEYIAIDEQYWADTRAELSAA